MTFLICGDKKKIVNLSAHDNKNVMCWITETMTGDYVCR